MYASISPSVSCLIHVVCFWAKRKGFSGGQSKLTNYALTILIIHFLVVHYNVPSPQKLSDSAGEFVATIFHVDYQPFFFS
jgi:hypothetical protein